MEKKKAEARQKADRRKKEIDILDAKADRERYYAKLRWEAEQKAEAAQKRALSDPEYFRIHNEARKIEIGMAKANVLADHVTERSLAARHKSLMTQRAEILTRLHLTDADLIPKYRCGICEDSGYRKRDGLLCSCYDPPERTKQAEKKPAGN